MIFKAIRIYRMGKQGLNDPAGLVSDELRDAFIGVAIIPAIILFVVLVLLGILSFTSLITNPSVVAQVFFWILAVIEIAYVAIIVAIGRFLGRMVNAGVKILRKDFDN